MFTGIIRHVGKVACIGERPGGRRLAIDVGPLAAGLGAGDSLAVNGVCLTAVRGAAEARVGETPARRAAGTAATQQSTGGTPATPATRVREFDVVAETLSCTTLGRLRIGMAVNLEPALRLGDSLDGHMVQGHVDGVATLRARLQPTAQDFKLQFNAGSDLLALMVVKGSVAIDGVSLTLVDVEAGRFSVALIPTTLDQTTLGGLEVGRQVNVETDIIGKYVRRFVGQVGASEGLTLEKLKDAGFA
jgi:riboflavin synthase